MHTPKTLLLSFLLVFSVLEIAEAKTNYAYTANYSTANVSVINTSNNMVLKTIPVGVNPWGVAVNQAGTFAYVTNISSNNVSVISTSTNTVVGTIPVGSLPTGIALTPNGKTAYVSNTGGGSVSVINTATKKVTATVTVQSNPTGLSVTPNGAYVYVANAVSGNVSVISTLTNTVVATISAGLTVSFVPISPDGSTVYAINSGANNISVIRTADNTVVNTINVPGPYGASVSPDGHSLYVVNYNGGTGTMVTVIDTKTQTVTATIVVGTGPVFVAFSEDSAFAYVTNKGTNNVSVINTSSRTVVNTISLGASSPENVVVMGTVKVSTVAGGYVGDKGPATSAALDAPYSSALDSAGNLYISDVEMHRIRKVDAISKKISTYAGNGICGFAGDGLVASKALICGPNGLAIDPAGNLIFADGGNSRIRKIDHSTGKITTIAGNGVFDYTGDGGPALNAAIGQPFQINYDGAGSLYFDQVDRCVVRKVDTSGTITTVAGTGTCGYNNDNIPAVMAELNGPRGVAVDGNGNLYIGDTLNHLVRKVDGSGIITTFAGTLNKGGFTCSNGGLATNARIGTPRGLTVFNNTLYIGNGGPIVCAVDLASDNITQYAGSFFGYDGDGHSLLATEFQFPTFVHFDASGNPIFDDGFNGRVRKATGGIVQTIAGGYVGDGGKATSAALVFPGALAIDKAGNYYVADWAGNRVRKVSAGVMKTIAGTGITGYTGDEKAGTSATLNAPQGVAVDSTGNVFIADTSNNVIREVNAAGTITTFATNANFSFLLQMATDSSNNVYVADAGSCVVFKITPAAVVSIVAGVVNVCSYNGDGIAATTAQLNGPYAVTLDSHGNLFIADNGNNRIREVDTSGTISTVTGDGNCGYSGDGGSASVAEICSPFGVAVDKSGTVYLSDFNNTVRKISGGTITAYAGTGPLGFGFTGDGLWPLLTNFTDPIALAVDSKNVVYVLDDFQRRIRKIQ